MDDFYPIVLMPKVQVPGDVFQIISEPVADFGDKPVKRETEQTILGGCFCCIALVLFIVGVIYSTEASAPLIGGLFMFFAITGVIIGKVEENANNKENNQHADEYESQVTEYNKKVDQYNAEVTLWNKYVKISEGSAIKMREWLHRSSNYSILDEGFYNNVTRGMTEKYFEEVLNDKFGNKIKTGKCVKSLKDFSEYYPDYIYQDKENHVYIDIEIDEPYNLKTLEPIHLKETDVIRNSFFTSNYWYVVRFAEVQILKDSSRCLKILEDLISSIEAGEKHVRMDTIRLRRWDKSSSEAMARNKVRSQLYN